MRTKAAKKIKQMKRHLSSVRRHPARTSLIAVLTIVVVAALWFAIYTFSRVGADLALINALSYATKYSGSYHLTSDKLDVNANFDGELLQAGGVAQGMKFDFIIDGDMLYIKTSDPKKFTTTFIPSFEFSPIRNINDLVASTLTNKWFRLDIDTLPRSSNNLMALYCRRTVKETIAQDNTVREIAGAYLGNSFLRTKLIDPDHNGNNRYTVSVDREQINTFFSELIKTDVGERAIDCAGVIGLLRNKNMEHALFDIVVDPKYKRIVSVRLSLEDEVFHVISDYAKSPSISIPRNYIELKDAQKEALDSYIR